MMQTFIKVEVQSERKSTRKRKLKKNYKLNDPIVNECPAETDPMNHLTSESLGFTPL